MDMNTEAYARVLGAVGKAAHSPESDEAREEVLAACEEWFQSHFGPHAMLALDTFSIANSIVRRWRKFRRHPEKWAHIGATQTNWVAVRRVYFLMFSLLWRMCLSPESLHALVFEQLFISLDECHLAVKMYDHPQQPVPES